MMRQTLNDDAPHVTAVVASQANRVYTYQRSSSGGSTTQFGGGGGTVPIWLRLELAGSHITKETNFRLRTKASGQEIDNLGDDECRYNQRTWMGQQQFK